MNKKQKTILIIVATVLFLMLLIPPMAIQRFQNACFPWGNRYDEQIRAFDADL